ncbi:MAG: hypothetical protein HY894_07945 [Deltaproteobacteria bacterium]|nr:hypothetical protein [Deltaproteobacteria bacterium]
MTDQRIQYTEKMVGAGHPSLADTLNRLALVEHNDDGTHKADFALAGANDDILSLSGLTTPLSRAQGGTGYAQAVSPFFAARHTPSSVTGTVNETELYNCVLPANTLGLNGALRIKTLWSYTNSANAKTIKVKFGGTAFLNAAPTTTSSTQAQTFVHNRNSASSQIAYWGGLTTFGSVTSGNVTAAIDTTVDQVISITGQLANTGETITLESVVVEVLK